MTTEAGYETSGKGTPVVLIHGSMTSKSYWRPLADDLSGHYAVMAVDLSGYGDTPFPQNPESHRLEDEVETIRRTLSNVRGFDEPLHIVAHSYGGAVALCHACRYPGEIASLILFEPMPMHLLIEFNQHHHFSDGQHLIDRIATLVEEQTPQAAAKAFVDYFSGDGTFSMLPSSAQNNLSRYVHKMLLDHRTAVHTDLRMADYSQLTCPITLITGRSSSRVSLAVSRLLIDNMPSIHWIEVPGGHMAPVSNPQVVNPVIVKCLQRHIETLETAVAG
ncbi:MAG: alpha/beta hydrolase [Desulfobacteraceae bacterium]|jgi:pimeloyl-ACP methyl ester carboxylesterase